MELTSVNMNVKSSFDRIKANSDIEIKRIFFDVNKINIHVVRADSYIWKIDSYHFVDYLTNQANSDTYNALNRTALKIFLTYSNKHSFLYNTVINIIIPVKL